MKKIYVYIFLLIGFISISSCNIFKKSTDNIHTIQQDSDLLKITDSLKKYNLDFRSVSASFSAKYITTDRNIFLKGNMRIIKDSVIWLSLRSPIGIEAGRVYITGDSIKFLNRFNKEYIIEDIQKMNKMLKGIAKYNHLESLLLNRMFYYPDTGNMKSYSYLADSCAIIAESQSNKGIFFHSVKLSENKTNILSNNISLNKQNVIRTIYSDFKEIESKAFPYTIQIEIINNNIESDINLNYKKIVLNNDFSLPFKIPETYKRITIE